jgi:hypothetical protein
MRSVVARFHARLDLASHVSVITTDDIEIGSLPLDDADDVDEFSRHAVRCRASLTFHDSEYGRVPYLREVLVVNGPAGSSRIGCDILDNWLLVIDRTDGTLILEPRAWDLGQA